MRHVAGGRAALETTKSRIMVKSFAGSLDVEGSRVRMGHDSSLERFQVQPKWEMPAVDRAMSYCIFITNRTNDEGARQPITLDQWSRLVDSDDELALQGGYRSVRWLGVSSQLDPSFEWDDGEIVAHNPDTAQLKKMRELAARLGARVVTEEAFEITGNEDDGEFDPASAYDYNFEEVRRQARAVTFPGVKGFLLRHQPVVTSLLGLAVVIGRATVYDLFWLDYLVVFLAVCSLALHLYYTNQERCTNKFEDWLLDNIKNLSTGSAYYRGDPISLDTRVTRFDGAYSFVISNSHWSRWYVVGIDDVKGKWIHSLISIFFGSWGLPLGPLETAISLLNNLPAPHGDMLTVRNLCLRLDDRLCNVIGRPDPEVRRQS